MFEFLFPLFCFGVVVTGIVIKGLLLAFEENRLHGDPNFDAESRKILHAFRLDRDGSGEIERATSSPQRRRSL